MPQSNVNGPTRIVSRKEPGLFVNLLELVRAAPVMVPIIYGIPIGLFTAGIICTSISALVTVLAHFHIVFETSVFSDMNMAVCVIMAFMALPVYWILAASMLGCWLSVAKSP